MDSMDFIGFQWCLLEESDLAVRLSMNHSRTMGGDSTAIQFLSDTMR
jgi:hypothetical protein